MSWIYDVAVLPVSGELGLGYYVPDVLGPTGCTVDFEETASLPVRSRMFAARIQNYVVVLDPACRIMRSCVAFLESIDAPLDAGFFYRITNYPVEAVVENGEEILNTYGKPELLVGDDGPSEFSNTADAAIWALKARTGLSFPDDFMIEYEEFGPD